MVRMADPTRGPRATSPTPRTPAMPRRPALALPIALLALAGCDDTPPPATPALHAGPAPAAKPAPVAEAPKPEPLKPREILGKRTTDIRDAQKEVNSGSAVKAAPRKLGKDPITIAGNAYVS